MGKIKIYVIIIGLFLAFPSYAVDPISTGFFLAEAFGTSIAMWQAVSVAFITNFAISSIVSRVFSKKPPKPQDNGVRQQIPPASTNSIPIVYGDAFLGGTFVDAVLTTDQKTMWYALAISNVSPNGQFTFDKTKFYYGDRLVTFDTTDPAKVVSLTDGSGNVDTKIDGNLWIYLYRSTNAGVITNLDNGGTSPGSGAPDTLWSTANGIPSGLEWPSSGRQMNGLAFALVKLVYSQEDDATQLQQLTFKCNQSLNGAGVAKPGDVWYDYITNSIYGGAIETSLVNSASAIALNAYSDELITFTNNQGNPSTQPRYRINGVIDTGQTVLENLDLVLMAADSWMAYDAPTGQWSIVINKAESSAFSFNDTNIVGDIKVGTVDINQAINQIEAKFPSKLNKDIPDYIFLETPAGLLYPNEPVNKYTLSLDLVNDSVQAQYLCNRMLEQAREDLIVTIKTTYAGIQINAGDVVSVTNTAYGWSGKLFRTMKVNEVALPDGSLGAALELNEYNAQVYDDKPITEFQPAGNTDIPSSTYFSALSAPIVTDQLPSAAVPSFSVDCVVPLTGRVTTVTLYYTTVSSPTVTDWYLLGIQNAVNSQAFANNTTVKFTHIVLPTGTYYFAFKVSNQTAQSILSPSSAGYAWSPNPTSTVTGASFVAQFSPPTLQVPYDGISPTFTGIAPQLYGTVAGGAIDYIDAGTDSDTLFVNNSWRIGASSTTGLGDIVKTNITIGNPTDAGNYALFPAPTAMPGSPASIEVPIRYKDNTGTVYQSATAICQLVYAVKGDAGIAGNKTATAYLYQWATSQPSNPNGQSTYTWATGTNASYTGGNGWATTISANPGTPSIKLWTATKAITAPGTDVTTTVDWTSGFSVQAISQNGANGIPGLQSATPTVYKWDITIPAGPTGTSTYTWSTNTFTPTPSGWTLTGGTAPSVGYTLWAAKVNLVDSATATTSSINWTTSTISAIGYAGTNGTNGSNAQILTLTSTADTITFDGTGTASPASQTITFTANLQNLSGTATFTCTAYNSSNTSLGTITLGGSGNTRTLTNTQFVTYANTAYVKVDATLSGFTDTNTVIKLQAGTNAVVGYLTNEAVTLAASSTGVVSDFTPANGNFKVYYGTTDVTASSTFSLVSNTGCTAAITAGGAISVSAMSADSATALFQAVYSGVTIQKTLSLAKSYAGADGSPGTDGATGSSARICYAKTTLSTLASTPTTYTTTGITSIVRVATTANITLSGLQTIDGITVVSGDQVLVKNQTTQANNGIYTVSSGAWSRSASADTWAEFVGLFVYVSAGTAGANTTWQCTVVAGGTLGSTSITFASSKTNSTFPPGNTWGTGLTVRVGTTANITLSGTQIIDGVTVAIGDRVLVKNQTTQSTNGIYLVASGAWTRTTDADTWAEFVGMFVYVTEGTTLFNTNWNCTVSAGGTLGTTSITFASSTTVAPFWQAVPPTFNAGESVYQSDGIYSPVTGITTWTVPYLSALKVGSLSAITVNTGALSVTDALTVGTTGSVKGGQTDYSSGTGFFLGYSGGAYKFSVGSSSSYLRWDGSALSLTGSLTCGTAAVSGTTMTGSGAQLNSSGTFALGNSTKNLSFNGTTLTMNGELVVTGNLVANSVTALNYIFTAGSFGPIAIGSTQTVQSGTYTASGAPVLLNFALTLSAVEYSLSTIRVLRGSTVLYTQTNFQANTTADVWSFTYVDTPPAGSVTYSITVNPTTSTGIDGTYASNRLISALECKK